MATPAPIKIEVYFTPQQFDERQYKDKNIVVIDVLRSSTTIAMALQNGAREIIPVKNIENALKISGSLAGDVTLRGGERNGKMIEGFNLGNSPVEYTAGRVKGKSIILLTTNGSPAIASGRSAKNLFIAGFVNLASVVKALEDLKSDFVIICSGQDGKFSLEDTVCAGKIINMFISKNNVPVNIDDSGTAAVALDKAFGRSIPKLLATCDHGKYLASIGFMADLEICGFSDSIPVVPMLSNGTIRLLKPQSTLAAESAA
jgi:2-phosphosulfolactate phosphatase